MCDFGVSIKLEGAKAEDFVGTGPWMAPEAMEDERPLTEKADVFSLGLIIWEMLTLKIPHTGDDCNNTSFSGSFDSSTVECEQHYGEFVYTIIYLTTNKRVDTYHSFAGDVCSFGSALSRTHIKDLQQCLLNHKVEIKGIPMTKNENVYLASQL